ncbi:COG1832 Predicted CoA-binding protein [Fimbriimonadaceae bacterium]
MAAIACDIRLNTRLTPEQRALYQNGEEIQRLIREARTIAIVGLSTEKTKASNMVGSYLQDEGYRVIPVNPRADEILGEKSYPDLKSIPEKVDVAIVFRAPSEVAAIVDDVLEVGIKAIWTQLRIIDLPSAQRGRDAGVTVVMDKCMKMEHGRYSGALHMAGMNTEVVTAQRRKFRAA